MLICPRSVDHVAVHLKGYAATGPPSRWSRAEALASCRALQKRVKIVGGRLARSNDKIACLKLCRKEIVARMADT